MSAPEPNPKPPGKWLTCGELARKLNRHRNTIRRWAESDKLLDMGYATYKDSRGVWFIMFFSY